MFKTIDQSADCEIRSVIRFLTAKNVSAAEIHRQISDVYGPNAMSSSKVRKWVRAFKDGRENVHDEPRSGRPSVITQMIWSMPWMKRFVKTGDSQFQL
ncbi:HTH_48 domain-containing protein [Trichonephila clavipes]|nr:HTH_48 domain-containing protein [Trichonephila clavipes]